MTTINYSEMIKENAERNTFNVREEYKHMTKEELDKIVADSRLPYAVAALNITGDLNVSGIIRSAAMFGAEKVLLIGRKNFDRRGAVGAQNYVTVEKYSAMKDETTIDAEAFFNIMSDNKYIPIAVETGGDNFYEFIEGMTTSWPWKNKKPCFIMGQEGTGIPLDILEQLMYVVTIPQLGVMRSLNVASAASIIMCETARAFTNNFIKEV
jgi:tRNA G18 (ribose-2'-O)-methylase SpoU